MPKAVKVKRVTEISLYLYPSCAAYRKQWCSIDAHTLGKAHTTGTRSQLGTFAGREKRRFAARHDTVRHRLTDKQRNLRFTGAYQLYDMISGCIFNIFSIDCEYLITRLQLAYAGSSLRDKAHNHRTLTAGNKAKAQARAALQQHQAWLWRMLIPSDALGSLISGCFI